MESSTRSNNDTVSLLIAVVLGVGAVVCGTETFAKHLATAASQVGVSAFALALLLAGAEPEELATAVTAPVRHMLAVALGLLFTKLRSQ